MGEAVWVAGVSVWPVCVATRPTASRVAGVSLLSGEALRLDARGCREGESSITSRCSVAENAFYRYRWSLSHSAPRAPRAARGASRSRGAVVESADLYETRT